MEQLITFLFFFVLALYLLRWLVPLFLRHYIKKKIKDGGNVFGAGYGSWKSGDAGHPEEGKVSVSGKDARNKMVSGEMGEYVDFVEEKNEEKV